MLTYAGNNLLELVQEPQARAVERSGWLQRRAALGARRFMIQRRGIRILLWLGMLLLLLSLGLVLCGGDGRGCCR